MLFYIKYQLPSGTFRLLNSVTKQFITINTIDQVKDPKFDLLSQEDGEKTDEFALKYLERFNKWCDELKNGYTRGFDYRNQFTDALNVSRCFNYFCLKNCKDHGPISCVYGRLLQRWYNAS